MFVGVMSLTRGAVRRSVNVNFRSMWPCYPGRFNVVRLCGMSIDKKKNTQSVKSGDDLSILKYVSVIECLG